MFFLHYIMINLVLTKSSDPKRHAVFAYRLRFLPVSGFPPPPTQLPHLGVGENAAAMRDGIHN